MYEKRQTYDAGGGDASRILLALGCPMGDGGPPRDEDLKEMLEMLGARDGRECSATTCSMMGSSRGDTRVSWLAGELAAPLPLTAVVLK